MRLIVLDTETTGLDPDDGHKIIEIGCVEIINREVTQNVFHRYINPNREIDAEASKIHGMTLSNLKDKPIFEEIYKEFSDYISDSPVIIHNAPFDVGFIKKEIINIYNNNLSFDNQIIDSLKLARSIAPGKRNSLDALCERYKVDNSDRNFHGALLDAKLLAYVYLKMTIGQNNFSNLKVAEEVVQEDTTLTDHNFRVIQASKEETMLHKNYFKKN